MATENDSTSDTDAPHAADTTSSGSHPIVEASKDRQPGRPKKSEIEAAKKPGQGKRGRPPGITAKVNELKARMMVSGPRVIDKVVQKAMNDHDPDQMAALKLIVQTLGIGASVNKDITGTTGDRGGISVTVTVADPSKGVASQQAFDRAQEIREAEDIDFEVTEANPDEHSS